MADSSFFKNNGTSTQLQGSASASAAAALASEQAAAASQTAASTSETNSAASAAASATSAAQALSSANSAAGSQSNAATSEANALASSTNAQEWAVKTNGIVDSTDYASKAWAIGGTGVTGGSGASKEWSTHLGSTVDGSEYSAKHYSQVAATEAADAAADAVATAADRVQTGLDVVAAAGSATAASNSQIAAANSAAAAAATLDTFDDRYLGSFAADPTVDNDGDPLVTGALYFSNTANEMRVFDGGSWIAASSAGGASLINYHYTATAAQTTFSSSDDNSRTLSYTVGNLIVTRNGVVLEDGTDYTASNGSTITLAVAAAAGDEINVVAFKSFTTADMVSATNGGAFQGNVDFAAGADVTGNITVTGTVDGRDVAKDGTKLDGIEAGADVTDATNVAAAGAAMLTGANFTGNVDVTGTVTADGLTVDGSFRQTGATAPFEWTVNAGAADYYKLNSVGYSDNIIVATAAGRVGIGTASPETVLHTQTNAADTAIFNNSVPGLGIVTSRNTSTSGIPGLALRSWSTWTSPKDTGQIRFDGLTSTGAYTEYGGIYLSSSTNTSTGAASTMKFSTSDGTASATERLRIKSNGQIYAGAESQSIATFGARKAGAAIEFGHANNTAGYYGTLGSYGSAGIPYIGFSADAEESVNTFTTRGFKGNLLVGGSDGSLSFSQLTNASATGQTPTLRMQIDPSGRVTMPYQPSFAVTRNQGSVSNAVYVYSSAFHNIGNHYNSSNGRFTAPVTGSYFIATNHMNDNTGTQNNVQYAIRVNGGTHQLVYSSSGINVHTRWSWAGVIYLNQGDYIDILVSSGLNLYGNSTLYTQFSGYLLG